MFILYNKLNPMSHMKLMLQYSLFACASMLLTDSTSQKDDCKVDRAINFLIDYYLILNA